MIAFLQGSTGGSSIVIDSPFLPPGFHPPGGSGSQANAPVTPSQLKFKGVYRLNGVYYFHIYDARLNKGSWIKENEQRDEQPEILRYQADENVLVVESEGKVMSLDMIETSDKPIPLPTPPASARQIQPDKETSAGATVRRRVIRPTTRSTPQPARRATIPPPANSKN